MLAPYANQKVVNIHRDFPKEKEPYVKIKTQRLVDVMNALSPNAFKLYIYFIGNKDGWKMFYSSAEAVACTGMSKPTEMRMFEELVNKGFLVKKEGSTNEYEFYEEAQK